MKRELLIRCSVIVKIKLLLEKISQKKKRNLMYLT